MNYRKSVPSTGLLMLIAVTLTLASGASAQLGYKTLHKFPGGKATSAPFGGVIFDGAGNLYGTTLQGGTPRQGTVYELTPNSDGTWTESDLYSFCPHTPCPDGAAPVGGLVFDAAGNLYGATEGGGAGDCHCGVVFELSPSGGIWTERVLYSFTGPPDGSFPLAGLTLDKPGNLYGTTSKGGVSDGGTAFQLTPGSDGTWTEKVLHSFKGGADGDAPRAPLTFDPAGNLYGTTYQGGGGASCLGGCGVVFELTPNSDGTWTEKVLHRFKDGHQGSLPESGLTLDHAGNLYGTTPDGGPVNVGVVFELTPNSDGTWTESLLHHFKSSRNGWDPFAGLIFDQAGNLYGTTGEGGDLNHCLDVGCGVVFKLTPNTNGVWKETVLHIFHDDPGGAPSGVILDPAGNLYGTTLNQRGVGTVFEVISGSASSAQH